MAIEINSNNNKANSIGFNDDTANLNLPQDTVQDALEKLDSRVDVNEATISQLQAPDATTISSLSTLTDVTIESPVDQEVLQYDGTSWVNTIVAGASTIEDIGDLGNVTITNPLDNQVLTYNGTGWVNEEANSPGLSSVAINDLTDVNIDSPNDLEILTYDSATNDFINRTAGEAGLATSTHVHSASDITSGTFIDSRISETNVTQHESALSINESQIADLGVYLENIGNEELSDLSNVSSTAPNNSQVLTYNSTSSEWEPQDVSSTSSSLAFNDLTDVLAPVPANDHLVYFTSSFGGAYTTGPIGTILSNKINFNQLADVQDASYQTGDFTIYNGTEWELRPPVLNDISNVTGTPTDGQVLAWNNTNSTWEPQTVSGGGGGGATNLNSLTDVTIDSIGAGEFLTWDATASQWINRTANEAGISITTHTHDGANITTGTIPDARIASSSITQHESSLTITESQVSDLGNYEPTFTKNNAFNKDFGTTAGTVTQGNDSRLSDARTPTFHTHFATDITSGTFNDGRIAESSVTQHQAALSITESQVSDLGNYLVDITGQPLTNLNDVSVISPSTDQVLSYNGTAWVNSTPSADISSSDLEDLSNVTGAPTDGQILIYSSANSRWEPGAAPSGGGGGSSFSGCRLDFKPNGRTRTNSDSATHNLTLSWGFGANIVYDTDFYYSVSFGSRLTMPTDGIYEITGYAEADHSLGSSIRAELDRNGSFECYLNSKDVEQGAVTTNMINWSTTVVASAADYFEITIYLKATNSSGDLKIGDNTAVTVTRLYEGTL